MMKGAALRRANEEGCLLGEMKGKLKQRRRGAKGRIEDGLDQRESGECAALKVVVALLRIGPVGTGNGSGRARFDFAMKLAGWDELGSGGELKTCAKQEGSDQSGRGECSSQVHPSGI